MNYKGIDICCPHCKGELDRAAPTSGDDRLRCVECERLYPVVAGIPDLRVFPDPYIDVDADHAKGLKVADQLHKLSFQELIEYYYDITSVVPPKHAKLYARGLMAAAPRAEAALESWEKELASGGPSSDATLLEIGCGTAPLLVAAAPRCAKVVGVDIAFRWLVLARKRLDEAGLDVPLICACAETLPFRDESFDRVVADSTLEVVKEQHTTLAEANRVLRPGGALCISTPNRFSIGPDPHTGVWGGSWLPQNLTAAIVRRQGGIPPKRKLLSAAGLRRSIRSAGFTRPTVMLPDVPEGQRKMFTGVARVAVNGYCLARRLPVSAQLLHAIGPVLHAVATKPSTTLGELRVRQVLVNGVASHSRRHRQAAAEVSCKMKAGVPVSTNGPTKCISCGSDRLSRRRPYRTNTKFGRRVFRGGSLYECDACHLVHLAPQPDPQVLADYYAWDYRRVAIYGTDVADPATFPKDNLFYYNRGQSAASLLAPHVTSQRPVILDIGAGYGHVLHALAERFPESERMAIEFSAVCVRHLEKLGVRVFDQPAESVLPGLDKQFDLVIISHVLEHVQDPRALLELVRTKLKPGGLLYVEVPNIPLDAVLRYPDHVWAPRYDEPHISFFSEDSLRSLLESIGLDVGFADTAGPEYRYISPLRFRMPHARWALQRAIPKPLFHFLRRRVLTKPLRVNEREEAFYKYGGFRIWIRSISRWPGKAMSNASLPSEAYAST